MCSGLHVEPLNGLVLYRDFSYSGTPKSDNDATLYGKGRGVCGPLPHGWQLICRFAIFVKSILSCKPPLSGVGVPTFPIFTLRPYGCVSTNMFSTFHGGLGLPQGVQQGRGFVLCRYDFLDSYGGPTKLSGVALLNGGFGLPLLVRVGHA